MNRVKSYTKKNEVWIKFKAQGKQKIEEAEAKKHAKKEAMKRESKEAAHTTLKEETKTIIEIA